MHSHIGKYEIQKLLGKGATGSVWLASDPFAGREVAIKVLDAMPSDPEEARRALKFFQNEASLAGKLRHPHIVSIFDAGVDKKDGKDLRYLVMELVEGTSLQPHCEPSDLLPVSRTAQIAYKCCRRSSTPTRWASCTATSSPPTSCCGRISTSRCRTSAPRSSRARTPRRSRAWARPPTCRPSRSAAARRSTSAPTCSRWAA